MISPRTARFAIDVHKRRATPNVGEHGSLMDVCFLALAMAGEAGEAANVVKKAWRDGVEVNRDLFFKVRDVLDGFVGSPRGQT